MKKGVMSLWNWAWKLFKKYPAIIIFFCLGVGFWLIQYKLQRAVGHIVPSGTTIFKLLSYFCLLVSPYLLLLKKKRYLWANLIILGPIVIAIEFTCFLLLGAPDKPVIDFDPPDLPADHLHIQLGYGPNPNDSVHDQKDGIFEVDYYTDEYSRRITPGYDSSRSEYALFFGCSIAFGYGVNGDETMAYYYQQYANCNSKNYAYNGYGTNQMLARLQCEDLSKQVEEKEGVAYYLFFWDHIKRAIGTMDRYNEWVAGCPYYYLDGDSLKRDGSFRTGRYWTSRFYEFAYQTSIARYFEIDFPSKLNSDHYDLISEIVLESKRAYERQFGNDRFYLVFYPTWKDYEESELEELKTFLDRKGIEYIDLNTFMVYKTEDSLGEDSHPNANTNRVLAEELYKRYQQLQH